MRHPIQGMMAGAILATAVLSPISPAHALPFGAPDKTAIRTVFFASSLLGVAITGCELSPTCANALTHGDVDAQNDIAKIAIVDGLLVLSTTFLLLDPIDLNFMTVAPPVPAMPPALSPFAPASLVNLGIAITDATSLVTAMSTAFNRAEGALVSGAPTFEQLQLNAYNGFEIDLSTDVRNIGLDVTGLVSNLGLVDSLLFGSIGSDLASAASGLTGSTTSADLASTPVGVWEPSSVSSMIAPVLALLLLTGVRRRRSV